MEKSAPRSRERDQDHAFRLLSSMMNWECDGLGLDPVFHCKYRLLPIAFN